MIPTTKPPEFRRRAVELACQRDKPVKEIAADLDIAESCLRRWMRQADVDDGDVDGTSTDDRTELARLRRSCGSRRWRSRSSSGPAPTSQIVFRLVSELAADGMPVAVACRVLAVSRAGFYQWRSRSVSDRAVADAQLTVTITAVHASSRTSCGAPRVHAELQIGLGVRCGRKRVARLMCQAGRRGICHRRKRRRPDPATHVGLMQRRFTADRPDRIWFTEITQHRAADGWGYCCAVVDDFSRRVVGWSIADHLRTELVVDALQIARWRRKPAPGTIGHADRGTYYTSWLFGHRLRTAGLLGSMGRVTSSVDNALVESFWSTMQRELLDKRSWTTRNELAGAIFEWIEGWYNPQRRHTSIGDLSHAANEALHNKTVSAA